MHYPHLILHGAHVANDAPRPIQNALPFRRQTLKPTAAKHQPHAKLILQLTDGAAQGWLGNTAHLSRPAKVPLCRQSYEHFQLVDHAITNPQSALARKPLQTYLLSMKFSIPFLPKPPLVNVIRLNGTIGTGSRAMSDASMAPLIERAFAKGKPVAVALLVNSPGGSPVQSSLIAARIRRLSDEKKIPVHAFVEDMAASGGYWLACAGDDIWVDTSSLVGSIGVIFASFGFPELMAKQGIERRVVTAGKSKSLADPFLPQKSEDINRLRAIQTPIHDAFIAHVKTRRGARLTDADLFNADIWAGQRAVELGLVDGIGHLVPKLKQLYGDKVRLVPHGQKKGLLSRFGLNIAEDALAVVEERALWAHYGL
jgi:signal peptide peptidase SppA